MYNDELISFTDNTTIGVMSPATEYLEDLKSKRQLKEQHLSTAIELIKSNKEKIDKFVESKNMTLSFDQLISIIYGWDPEDLPNLYELLQKDKVKEFVYDVMEY
jgi:hypothetical protein